MKPCAARDEGPEQYQRRLWAACVFQCVTSQATTMGELTLLMTKNGANKLRVHMAKAPLAYVHVWCSEEVAQKRLNDSVDV